MLKGKLKRSTDIRPFFKKTSNYSYIKREPIVQKVDNAIRKMAKPGN